MTVEGGFFNAEEPSGNELFQNLSVEQLKQRIYDLLDERAAEMGRGRSPAGSFRINSINKDINTAVFRLMEHGVELSQQEISAIFGNLDDEPAA